MRAYRAVLVFHARKLTGCLCSVVCVYVCVCTALFSWPILAQEVISNILDANCTWFVIIVARYVQSPRGLRRESSAARFPWLRVRIPVRDCECCVLSGRGVCVGLMTRPEESYLMCVCVCLCVCAWSWSLINDEAFAPGVGGKAHQNSRSRWMNLHVR
jgi:hypothetical protein